MNNFIIYSIIASIVLTAVVNLLPLIFPNAAAKVQRRIAEHARKAIEQHEDQNRPNIKVFFSWKVMLIGSIVLTLLVNLISLLAR